MPSPALAPLANLAHAWPLAKRDLLARYRGSVAGVVWTLLAPLAMVAVYALVFQGVFKARWATSAVDGMGYAVRLFAGLIVFSSVAEVASRATRLIQDNANLVKRVVFPLELLCLALVMQVVVHAMLQAGVLTVLLLASGEAPRWSWCALPLAALWTMLLQYAVALSCAALGCYLRDLQHLVPVVMSGLLFVSPVFYPVAAAPEALRMLLALNPMTVPIELARLAWFGDVLDWSLLWPHAAVLVGAVAGSRWLFRRLRPGFADLV